MDAMLEGIDMRLLAIGNGLYRTEYFEDRGAGDANHFAVEVAK